MNLGRNVPYQIGDHKPVADGQNALHKSGGHLKNQTISDMAAQSLRTFHVNKVKENNKHFVAN